MPSDDTRNSRHSPAQPRRPSLGAEGGKWVWFNTGEHKPQTASFPGLTQALATTKLHTFPTLHYIALNSYGNESASRLLMTSAEVKAER